MHTVIKQKKEISVGVLGHGFMGKAHSHAYQTIRHRYRDLDFVPRLYAIAGSKKAETEAAALQYGFERWTTDWQALAGDDHVDAVDICLPEDMHEEACLAAIRAGKHVLCEKPLALRAEGCKRVMKAAEAKGIKAMCGFNYRFLPAVGLAKRLIATGKIGMVYCVSASYAMESGHDPQRPADEIRYLNGKAPLGTIRGIGSHLIDIVRHLCGEIAAVSAMVQTMIPVRPLASGEPFTVCADDIALLNVELENGGIGTLKATALAPGRKNQLTFEINGSKGSLCFDLENLNVLSVYLAEGPAELRGFAHVNVTERMHPFMQENWPPAHILGWESGHIHELYHFLNAIDQDRSITPTGASFEDGYRAALIAEAAAESSAEGRKIKLL